MIRRGHFKPYQVPSYQEMPFGDEDDKRWLLKERLTEIHVISRVPVHGGSVHGAKPSMMEVRQHVKYHNTGKWLAQPQMSSVPFTTKDTKGIIPPPSGRSLGRISADF